MPDTTTETPDLVEVPNLTDPELMALVRANTLTAAMREFHQASQAYIHSGSPLVAARYRVARDEFIRQLVASSEAAATARREGAVQALRDAAGHPSQRSWCGSNTWLNARADAIENGDQP